MYEQPTLQMMTFDTVRAANMYTPEIMALCKALPYAVPDVGAFIEETVPYLSLIWYGEIPIGMLEAKPYGEKGVVVELSGVVRPDLATAFGPAAKKMKIRLLCWVLETVFETPQVEKVFCKVMPASVGGKGFVRMFGFSKKAGTRLDSLGNLDRTFESWVLERDRYYGLWKK